MSGGFGRKTYEGRSIAVSFEAGRCQHATALFDTEAALAAAVYSVARMCPGSFTGSSDHLVSKAFYFDDPEGNGVELYWDRDRTQWGWTHGQVEMGVLSLAPDGHAETVRLNLKKIREGVYLNSWTEASGATVTHVEDFANATLYSNVTVDGALYNLVGTITEA